MAELIGTEYLMGDIIDIIEMEVEDNLETKASSFVPVIVGDPGIGKSESLKAMARKMNMGIHIFSAGATADETWSGIPDFGEVQILPEYSTLGKDKAKTTDWSMSGIIADINTKTENAINEGKRGLVVIMDDLHLVAPYIQKYLFEFLQNKSLQNYKIHKDAILVGAMNGKESAGMEGFLSAVLNRLALYYTKFDKEFWYNAVGHSLHPYIASFAKGPNDKYFLGANAVDGASPSPRAWTELSNRIAKLEEKNKGNNTTFNNQLKIMAEARVGTEAAIEFMKHVKLFQKFDFETLFKKKDPNFKIPDDISDQILMAFVIRYMRSKDDVEYLIDIMNKNQERRTFISILINEYEVILRNLKNMPAGEAKEAFEYLNECIVSEEKVDEALLDTIVGSITDFV